jgi:hypothetical protein
MGAHDIIFSSNVRMAFSHQRGVALPFGQNCLLAP